MSGAGAVQIQASDPGVSAFVAANAGSGKTSTLVQRVTRLLLTGADPGAILCVTFTKAGAAEMQRRLFEKLGEWAVMDDAPLRARLAEIDEAGRDLSRARALFARALETPGGLKIQTLHAFCEKLLRRFPLEAGVAPGFTVMDTQASNRILDEALERVAELAWADPAGPIGSAYRRFAVALDYGAFNAMFEDFAHRREAIAAYAETCEQAGGVKADVWRRCGFAAVTTAAAVEAQAMGRMRWRRWAETAEVLRASDKTTDQKLGARMAALSESSRFAEVWKLFVKNDGELKERLTTKNVDPEVQSWLASEQERHAESWARLTSAVVAEDTVDALIVGVAYAQLYQAAKDQRGALDFGDLVTRALELLTRRADAAWVLYKLDTAVEHVLLDEAQDTSPEQWRILDALTAEFFHDGDSRGRRTVFVVGDEKQSIFSFQGARPERLAAEAQAFQQRAQMARMPFSSPKLMSSWRSRPEILALVDHVFRDLEAARGLTAPGATLIGLPHRPIRGAGGCVELWPVEEAETSAEPEPMAPVDAPPPRSANKLLARRIAIGIAAMVASGEAVGEGPDDEPRPCRFGDFLILVRRRGVLFDEIIRALKSAGVPLAGADRLTLSSHGLYGDLMALGRFARFSTDDLTLAVLLRGPFCDLDEQALFDLAHGRARGLWDELRARSRERPAWSEAVSVLEWALEAGGRMTPFAFYGAAMGRLDRDGLSMRQRILTRLGGEAQEALEGFLGQCLAAEAAGVRDLESFLAWVDASELEIKREQADGMGADEVRVMTVHGAKGLEAPIVILPDTTSRARSLGGPFLEDEKGGFLWAPRTGDDCEASAKARTERQTAVEHEFGRLLYVALTRARDRMIVCGPHLGKGHDKRSTGSWYDYVRRAFDGAETSPFPLPGPGEKEARRFGAEPRGVGARTPATGPEATVPAWARHLAPADPAAVRRASPSHFAGADQGPAPSPLARVGGLGRYRRGDVIHRLLQLLPDVGPEDRAAAAARLLTREGDLTDEQRAEMASAALGVLADPRFAEVFGPGSRAEVSVTGSAPSLPPDTVVAGRIDRLVVQPGRVLVADFKTNRPAPDRIEDADPAYVLQMALYAAVLAEIWPGRLVEAALVWTDGPRLMPVSEVMMRQAIAGLTA